MVTSSIESIELKVTYFVDVVLKEITKPDILYVGIQKNVDVLLGSTRTLIEDIYAFHKD